MLLTPYKAAAAWPDDPSVNLPVGTAAGNQAYPSIVSDGAGGAIVAWHDSRRLGSDQDYDIYAQHLLASGAADPAWPAGGLAVLALPGHQRYPVLVGDGAGGAILTWEDERSPLGGDRETDIYAQHVLASGALDPAWPPLGVLVCGATNYQRGPENVTDGAGGAIIAWSDFRDVGATQSDVYAQRVLANGHVDPAWPVNGLPVSIEPGYQASHEMIPDLAGGAVVTWSDQRSGNQDIYAQHVLGLGAADPAWPSSGRPVCTAVNDQTDPQIVPDGAGGAIVAWNDGRNGNGDVFAQHVSIGGAIDPAWPVDGRALCTAPGNQTSLTAVTDAAGGAIVAWTDGRVPFSGSTFAQHVLAGGEVDSHWPVDGLALYLGTTYLPAAVADGSGGAIVTWQDDRNRYDGDLGSDLFAQHVLHDGVLDPSWPAGGLAVSTALMNQESPQAATDGASGVIVAWTDHRNAFSNGAYEGDIYAQRVLSSGKLGGDAPPVVEVVIEPQALNLNSSGKWVTVFLEPQAPYTASQVDLASIRLNGSVPMAGGVEPVEGDQDGDGVVDWTLKFSRQAVQATLQPGDAVPVTVTGKVSGFAFQASDFIKVTSPHMSAPSAGATLTPGNVADVRWERTDVDDASATLIVTFDGGSTWNRVADGVPNTGAYTWPVPSTGTNSARLAMVKMSGSGDAGGVIDREYAETGTFAIQSPTSVPVETPRLSLRGVAPNPARSGSRVSFSLPNAAPATLAIFDVSGRLVGAQDVGHLGAGSHTVALGIGTRLRPGLYLVTLTQAARSFGTRVVVIE